MKSSSNFTLFALILLLLPLVWGFSFPGGSNVTVSSQNQLLMNYPPDNFIVSGRSNLNPSELHTYLDSTDNKNSQNPVFITGSDSLLADSLLSDSLKIDSLAIDSTARIKYFKQYRVDNPFLEFNEHKKSAFIARPSQTYYRRTAELDSTKEFVIIKEIVGNQEPKVFLKIPLDKYVALQMSKINKDIWKEIAYKYELKDLNKDFGQLLTDITNIEIPLPSTSFLSIFGPPIISLRISGAVDIHGAWRSETTEGVTSSRLGNTRNEPDFKQQVAINVSGTIGDKLTISADWNTERTFEYENQLKLKYTGYEDEIIQSIEAGNVSLQTSPLVGGSEALFGIKAQFQMGPFSLTALASQKKGEVKEVSVSGGSTTQKFEVHAYEYSQNHYFLDQNYADTTDKQNLNLFEKYYGNPNPIVNDFFRVKDIEVWKTATGIIDASRERKANAFINLDGKGPGKYPDSTPWRDETQTQIAGENIIGGRFIKLEPDIDYTVNEYTGMVSFTTQIQNLDAIAVAYRVENDPGPEDDIYYGEFIKDVSDTATTLVLRLVKPPNLQPSFNAAWNLQLKNIYPIKGRDVKKEGFSMDIRFIVDGAEPVNELEGKKLLETFKLDQTDESGNPNPDGAFDFIVGRTILPQTGEIIFPVLQPFGKNFPLTDQEKAYQAVYDTTVTFAQQDRAKDKFILTGEYSASVTSTYSIGFNVVENSVRVLLNGNELREGSDYSVDYNIGQVIIRNDAALVPGADLKITYEQNDLFALASKTLIGLRGIYSFSKESKLGFSFLNLNQQTLSDKVRIGEEPLNNSIFGLDFQTRFELPFITKGLDYLISTSTPSAFSLKGEFAYINPDPNTKKSTVASDENKSIAYIDDFEGAKRIIPIGMSDRSWSDISTPDKISQKIDALNRRTKMNFKGKSFWFNITPSNVLVNQIFGNRKQVAREDEQVTVLDYVFRPNERGAYNYEPDLAEPTDAWGGIMKLLSSTASNLVEENIQFVEFWMKLEENTPTDGKMFIDLGQISEDVIPNDSLDTEDKNQNDIEEKDEDTGIDGLFDAQEPFYDAILNPDPSNDNFSFVLSSNNDTEDYVRINGTEGNREFRNAGIKLPDTEDLNRNFTLDRVNSYFRYEVKLDTNALTNPFISGGGAGFGWYLFRVPLKDFVDKVGDPSFSVVENIRFWIHGVNQEVHLRFAEINLVGNQWQKVLTPGVVEQSDTVLTVGTINIEDNPNYTSPPGVFRERDRSKPDQEVFKNEQSLELIVDNLDDGDSREVVKYLFRPLDVFNYKEMKFFVHGDLDDLTPSRVSYYQNAAKYGSEVYFRFGSDSLNFYEYRQPVRAGWNEVKIVFEQLTAIKQARAPEEIDSLITFPVPDKEGHTFGVRGQPTLTRVTFFLIGILNPSQGLSPPINDDFFRNGAVSGTVWINELRVLNADDSPGWAYSASTSFAIADLMTVSANVSQSNPFFHRLPDRFGSRVDKKNWGVSVDVDVLKLSPVNLEGSNLRLNYSRTESIAKPLYLPGTDIFVDSAASQTERKLIKDGVAPEESVKLADQLKSDAQTINVSETWTLSNIKLKIPTNVWYFRDTFNSLTFGFNYNKSFGRNPTTLVRSNWVWNANGKYSLNFSKDYFIYPANLPILGWVISLFSDYRNAKFYFTPQSFSANVTARRKKDFVQNREAGTAPNIQRDFTATRNVQFNWKFVEGAVINPSLNYSLNVASSLAHLLTDANGAERREGEIWNDIFGGEFFGRDYDYKQNFDLKFSPRLPTLWDINRYFTITAGYGVNYNWRFDFRQDTLGRSAGFSNRLNAGLTLRWKSLTAPLFKEDVSTKKNTPRSRNTERGRGRKDRNLDGELNKANGSNKKDENKDDIKVKQVKSKSDSLEVPGSGSPILKLFTFLKLATKWILFDYDQFTFNFSQNNTASSSGIRGQGTGFNNFWGANQSDDKGPHRAFQLGLSLDPGERAPNGNLSDNFSQKNTIDFKTSRPLWEGAQIDLSWKVGWGLNKSTTINTDEFGNATVSNITSTSTINRSFLSLPLPIFGNSIVKVNELYNPNAEDPNKNLSEAFLKGFESIPWLSKIPLLKDVAKYIPRPNWRFSWSGLENFGIFKNFTKRVSLTHAYNSSYDEGSKINPDGIEEIQRQGISYGFAPLVGLNMTFNNFWGGNFTGSIKYSTKTSYDLGSSTRNINESFQKDISVTASFSKSGFEIPLFGVSLKNDIEISFSYTSSKSSIVIFEMDNFKEEGKPQDGTTRTTIEPRIKYVMSSRVTLSLFYKTTSVVPEGAARIPETTTNEAGLDVHISIQ